MNEAALEPVRTAGGVRVRRELLIVIGLAVVLIGLLTALRAVRIDEMRGDTAIFAQTIENIATSGRPVSEIFANTQGYIDAHYPTMTLEQITRDPLAPPTQTERNMLRFHFYLILYPLALLGKFFPPLLLMLFAYAASFVGLIVVAYLELRRARLPVIASLLFSALIVASPAWGQSALWGQFYPDRLFLLGGFVFMLLFARRDSSRTVQIVAAAICLLINERAAITAGLFAIFYTALYWRELAGERRFKAILGLALLAYGLIVIRFVINDPAYGQFLPTSLSGILQEFSYPAFAQMAWLYLLTSLPFLALACFEWRAAVIAFVLMLPNIIGNTGGAEKIGWVTHYHSYDFTVLVWAGLTGFIAAFQRFGAIRPRMGLYGLTAALALFLMLLDPYSFDHVRLAPAEIGNSFFAAFPQQASTYLRSPGSQLPSLAAPLTRTIPAGAVVTTPEGGMPLLYQGRTIRIFPIDVDHADYAVLNDYGVIDGVHRYGGTVNFLGPAVTRSIDDAMVARMRKDGYDFKHVVPVPGLSLAIVKRQR